MISYYVEKNNAIEAVDSPMPGCWVQLTAPKEDELRDVATEFALPMETVRAALDLDERSRTDWDDTWKMILVNVPTREEVSENELYTTIPMAIILAGECVITVCSKDTHVLRGFANGTERDFHPAKQSRFVFQILYATARRYLLYLRMVERKSDLTEDEFAKKQRNRDLLDLMKLEKSLVYFTTGLRSNEAVLEKLVRSNFIKKYEEDSELLEDVIVENKQAIEMAKINSEIITSMSNTFASVISNNLNVAMKVLAMITLVMAIPTMIFSAYGMNLSGAHMPLATHPWGFPIIIGVSALAAVAAIFVILRIKLFK
ncbi:MAG: magnesium transporter CorA family protein [Ruminococcaceae bacterium]|nr:magnesium transporter CorA family protein [Oscillospiraceae bacterium]